MADLKTQAKKQLDSIVRSTMSMRKYLSQRSTSEYEEPETPPVAWRKLSL